MCVKGPPGHVSDKVGQGEVSAQRREAATGPGAEAGGQLGIDEPPWRDEERVDQRLVEVGHRRLDRAQSCERGAAQAPAGKVACHPHSQRSESGLLHCRRRRAAMGDDQGVTVSGLCHRKR